MSLNLTGREQTETDIRAMSWDGTVRRVTVGSEVTWGFFEVEPKADLGDPGVIDDLPVFVVPSSVPGFTQDIQLTIDRLADDVSGPVIETGVFQIINRFPAGAGTVKLALRRVLS